MASNQAVVKSVESVLVSEADQYYGDLLPSAGGIICVQDATQTEHGDPSETELVEMETRRAPPPVTEVLENDGDDVSRKC